MERYSTTFRISTDLLRSCCATKFCWEFFEGWRSADFDSTTIFDQLLLRFTNALNFAHRIGHIVIDELHFERAI